MGLLRGETIETLEKDIAAYEVEIKILQLTQRRDELRQQWRELTGRLNKQAQYEATISGGALGSVYKQPQNES